MSGPLSAVVGDMCGLTRDLDSASTGGVSWVVVAVIAVHRAGGPLFETGVAGETENVGIWGFGEVRRLILEVADKLCAT